MQSELLHPWDVDPKKAARIQSKLKKHCVTASFNFRNYIVGGIDVSYKTGKKEAAAAIVVMDYPSMKIQEVSIAIAPVDFPYIPELLVFREGPAIVKAWEKLKIKPHLILLDGQGTAHPAHFGLACHMGVLLHTPSIGCAKSHLYGSFNPPAEIKGSFSYILDPLDNKKIGAVLRSRENVSCLYISPGYKMNLSSAITTVFALIHRYRLPEPLRLAHQYAAKGWD